MVCHHLAKFGGHRYCSSRHIMLQANRVIKGQVTLAIGTPQYKPPPAKFGGHKFCSSGVIMAVACHVTLQNRVI